MREDVCYAVLHDCLKLLHVGLSVCMLVPNLQTAMGKTPHLQHPRVNAANRVVLKITVLKKCVLSLTKL